MQHGVDSAGEGQELPLSKTPPVGPALDGETDASDKSDQQRQASGEGERQVNQEHVSEASCVSCDAGPAFAAGLRQPDYTGRVSWSRGAPSSHFLHSRRKPSIDARPSSVSTHGRLNQGGLWRTCWLWPQASSATQSDNSSR